jgi:uncharacterized protein YdeI (YjbR/CyaY-like superfamily)
MGTRDPRVDAYIAKSAEFAKPILAHLREVVHAACPEVEEAMKWSHPHFSYRGMLCGMAAFKQHCTFGFWKFDLIVAADPASEAAMGQFGRITKLSDLPSKKVLTGYIKQAMKLNEDGAKALWLEKRAKPKPAAKVPDDLTAALAKNKKARTVFEAFPPGQRREYIEWITEAKREETRKKRLAQTIEWLAEGKRRNWKYENC